MANTTPPERRNVAVVFGPNGDVILEYDKQHLVPGIERAYRAGNSIGLLWGESVPTGVAICKDLDFIPLGRAYARAGVGLLLVPAWDSSTTAGSIAGWQFYAESREDTQSRAAQPTVFSL